MTPTELYQALSGLGMPIAYSSFSKPVALPYLIYLFSYSNDLMADGHNYLEIGNYQIELYTDHKDLAAEKTVQDKLKELKLPYYKIETYLESEKLYQVIYEIQIIGG